MSSGSKIFLVADDLTGAADAAVAFAAQGRETRIVLTPQHALKHADEVVAVSIESRDASEEELPSRNAVLYSAVQEGLLCFRKIDSMFRGNTFAEIVLVASTLPDIPIVLASAYPALGRRLISGSVHWSDHIQHGSFSVEGPLRERGVQCVLVPAGESNKLAGMLHSYTRGAPTVFLCEAREQKDMDCIVAAGLAADRSILWLGSGGLALSLAAHSASSPHGRGEAKAWRGKVIFVVGSDHPVTLHQLQHLRAAYSETPVIVPVARGVTTAKEIHAAVAAIPRREIGCIFMTGGDTAMLACRALEVESLIVESEFAPGVPVVRISGGVLDGAAAILKSGGFGEAELLCQIAEHYRVAKEDAA